jgi:hypothetical protein
MSHFMKKLSSFSVTALCFLQISMNTHALMSCPAFQKLGSNTRLHAAGRGITAEEILRDPQWPPKWPFRPVTHQIRAYSILRQRALSNSKGFIPLHICFPSICASQEDFQRQDETSDSNFYSQPRLVYHIDDAAVGALTKYYKSVFFDGASVLDICSSW